jgi:hypothetical protein
MSNNRFNIVLNLASLNNINHLAAAVDSLTALAEQSALQNRNFGLRLEQGNAVGCCFCSDGDDFSHVTMQRGYADPRQYMRIEFPIGLSMTDFYDAWASVVAFLDLDGIRYGRDPIRLGICEHADISVEAKQYTEEYFFIP